MKVGAHISIAGGLGKAVSRARSLGCETMQVFSRSPRGGKARSLSAGELEELRAGLVEAGIGPLVVHVPYLLNLAAAEERVYRYSLELLAEDLARAEAMGAPYLVIHMGHYPGPAEDGKERVAQGLRLVLDNYGGPVTILLENTAGGRHELGHTFQDIAWVMKESGYQERLGICLDTCHAFAAGYDLASPSGIGETLGIIDREIGLKKLGVVHANDSRGALGSRLDRHEHIGWGYIGREGFRALLHRPELAEVPFILETPVKTSQDDLRNLAMLKELRPS